MGISPAKENILKKIRKALTQTTPVPFPRSEGAQSVYPPAPQELAVAFAEQFTTLQGRFAICLDHRELAVQLDILVQQMGWSRIYCRDEELKTLVQRNGFDRFSDTDLASCEASVTDCECLVARTGSIVMSAAQASGRNTSVYAPVHICIAYTHQLVYDVKDALLAVREKYGNKLPSLITFATGPSRTADIEKTLVVGVHGPKEVYCFLVDA